MSGIVRNEVIVKFDLRKTQPRGDDQQELGKTNSQFRATCGCRRLPGFSTLIGTNDISYRSA